MNRGRLLAVATGAVVLAGAIAVLRSGVEAPAPPVSAPDGQEIRAFHDPEYVDPPTRPGDPPDPPGTLRTDARRSGALVYWPASSNGFEVRWGHAGGPLDGLRYVASTSTTLSGLEPGRYRVEVRTVDDIGRRSEPAATDIEVSDQAPQWQQGLGFLRDFTDGADIEPDSFLMEDENDGCVSREGKHGPLLLGQCFSALRPASPLVLSEPDGSGVRGRVTVLADALPPTRENEGFPEEENGPGGNEFLLSVGPNMFYGKDTVILRIGMRKSFLLTDFNQFGEGDRTAVDQDVVIGPGSLHRWELAFTGTEVRVLRDGTQVAAAPFNPDWEQTTVAMYSYIVSDRSPVLNSRVGLIGLTGPGADGRPTENIRSIIMGDEATNQVSLPLRAVATAETVQLKGYIGPPNNWSGPDRPPPAPDVVGEFAGQAVVVRRQEFDTALDESGYPFEAALPAAAVRAGGQLTVRSVDGRNFALYEVNLQVQHEKGTELHRQPVRIVERPAPAMAAPEIFVRRDGTVLTSGQRLRSDEVQVEVSMDTARAQQPAGETAGWVALRVDLDGQRILDYPTAAGGPAIAGKYTFTLKLDRLKHTSKNLTVTVIPDRSGIAHTKESFTVRVED